MEEKLYKTHNEDQSININGTHLQGYCQEGTGYARLVELFGEPTTGDEYKVDAEWNIEFADGMVATIYNYKSGKNYCGDEGMEVKDMTGSNWHIGGNDKEVVERINDLIDGRQIRIRIQVCV